MSKVTVLVLTLVPLFSLAEDISIPHSFTTGTTIKSSEMNANFSAVAKGIDQSVSQISSVEENLLAVGTGIEDLNQSTSSNGTTLNEISVVLSAISDSLTLIDSKIASISAATVSDQLICRGQPRNLATETMLCLQASETGSTRSLTMAQIFSEGWIAVSVGGPDDYYAGYIFQK